MRLIDADALKKDLTRFYDNEVTAKQLIDEQPTVSLERPKGKWIDYPDEGFVECPFCHSATNCGDNIGELHYCFSCGAEMRGDNNDE